MRTATEVFFSATEVFVPSIMSFRRLYRTAMNTAVPIR